MAVKVKEIKMGKAEIQEAFENYWELFRQNVTLPKDPSLMGYSKQVFETGFLSGLDYFFDTVKEVTQEQSESLSRAISININHDPSKAN